MIQFSDIEAVLRELPPQARILGFDTFTLVGYTTQPRLDYHSEYGSGIPVADAIARIANWPRDLELWIEVVATE